MFVPSKWLTAWLPDACSWRPFPQAVRCSCRAAVRCGRGVAASRGRRGTCLAAEALEARFTPSGFSPSLSQARWLLHHAPIIHQQSAVEVRQPTFAPAQLRQAHRSTLLPIPPRQQWEENNGYCGETTIQSFALYFGTYASQYRIRSFISPHQQDQLLVGVNEQAALRALHLTFEPWNFNRPTPQAQKYLAWVKQKLQTGAPVMGTLYVKGMTDPDYDHIVPFIGFRSSFDATRYHAGDTLLFNDNFATSTLSRTFGSLAATRRGANTRPFTYAIPSRVVYGCAVTGIVDPLRETVPVRLQVDHSSEPDLIAAAQPITMNATLSVQGLVPGRTYSLLRYDDPALVPDSGFLAAGRYTSARTFTAAAPTQSFADQFTSSAVVTYRCVAT